MVTPQPGIFVGSTRDNTRLNTDVLIQNQGPVAIDSSVSNLLLFKNTTLVKKSMGQQNVPSPTRVIIYT